MLSEKYDEDYGIFEHSNKNRPLSLVAEHSKEAIPKNSLTSKIMKEFVNNDIGKRFNLSFLDYISMPISAHKMMVDICLDMAKKDTTLVEAFKEDLGDI